MRKKRFKLIGFKLGQKKKKPIPENPEKPNLYIVLPER